MPSIVIAEDGDAEAWDSFVYRAEAATFFHRFGWRRILETSFRHRAHYLMARRDGQICGVLPLVETRSILFGRKLSSLPFCVYGGILAEDEEAAAVLREAARELADKLDVPSLELRNSEDSHSGWPRKELYFTFRKAIASDHATNLKAIPNRQRAMLRKALKEGLYSVEVDDLPTFYRVYAESLRNLGTPVFSLRYLRELKQDFGMDCRVLLIYQTASGKPVGGTDDNALMAPEAPENIASEDECVAAVLSFYFKGEVLPYYGGGVSRARAIKGANHFLYWELMRRSVEEGISSFDFGRSKHNTGPFTFKKNFGFEPSPLPYEYYLRGGASIPDTNPNSPRYRRLVAIWQRLPLGVANRLGPLVAPSLG